MATTPTPQPQDPGAQQGGAPGAAPSQAPASPDQVMLAQLYQAARRLAESNPALSAPMQKVTQGIQEAQTALVTQPQATPTSQNPAY